MPPKFDMQAARDLLKVYAPGFSRPCEVEALAAALDEIERQAKQIAVLKSDIEQLTALVAAKDVDIVFVKERDP